MSEQPKNPKDGDKYTDRNGVTYEWIAHDDAHLPARSPGHWLRVKP